MATNFPSSIDSLANPTSTDTLSSVSHADQHANANDAIEALQTKVGADSSAVTSSIDYKLTNASSSNPGHKHTLSQGATDVTSSAAELNVLDGIPGTLTATELGYVDGVTSAIQTQIDAKVNKSLYAATGSILTLNNSATVAALTVGANGTVLSADDTTALGIKWSSAGAGDVTGPGSSSADNIVSFNGTTGKVIKDSGITASSVSSAVSASHAAATVSGTYDYITLTGQDIVRGQVDLATDVTGVLPDANVANNITLDNITQITTRSHTSLSDIGTNAHSAIDTFISSKAAASGLASLDGSSLVVQNPANATATPTASKIVIADAGGKVDGWVSASSDTTAGKVELATAAETTTGTDAARAVTPDGFAGSNYGKRIVQIKIFDDATAVTTGDGKFHFFISSELDGYNLVDADAGVSTVSSSGTPTVQIYNVTQTADMLSTRITIDANEKTSYSAATAPVIDAANDDVATGDELRIDVDVAGTGTKGLSVILTFQLP
jgi:hypothetical protein